jgi:hypothetical protein
MSPLDTPMPVLDAEGRAVDWLALTDEELLAHPRVRRAWGLALAVDLGGCNPALIRDAGHIARFAAGLCDHIGMRRFGETTVVRFGDDPRVSGYSMAQLIETSLVSGHFADATNAAYLDIFSCKPYAPRAAAAFCQAAFEATTARLSLTVRR